MKYLYSTMGFLTLLALTGSVVETRAENGSKEFVVAQATTSKSSNGIGGDVKRTTTTANYDGWVVTCVSTNASKGEACSANFRLADKEKKNILMTWLVGFNNKQVMMSELVTPTNVLIAPGVELIIGEAKPIKILYNACGTRGCKSSFPMSKKVQASFAKAKKVSVKFVRLDGRAVSFGLAFQGFGRAYRDLVK
jgi:invasion protein IalB